MTVQFNLYPDIKSAPFYLFSYRHVIVNVIRQIEKKKTLTSRYDQKAYLL